MQHVIPTQVQCCILLRAAQSYGSTTQVRVLACDSHRRVLQDEATYLEEIGHNLLWMWLEGRSYIQELETCMCTRIRASIGAFVRE